MTAPMGPTPTPPATDTTTVDSPAIEGNVAAIEAVRDALGEALLETVVFRGETTLVVTPDAAHETLRLLRDDPALRFDRLSNLTAVDYLDLGREPRFAVVYHLMSRGSLARLRVRALVPEDNPFIASIVDLYPSADWPEREVYDMFGIGFLGHPNLTRILMPDDWEGHPLRKDFPVGMEEVAFSFNARALDPLTQSPSSQGAERYRVGTERLSAGAYEPLDR